MRIIERRMICRVLIFLFESLHFMLRRFTLQDGKVVYHLYALCQLPSSLSYSSEIQKRRFSVVDHVVIQFVGVW